MQPTFEPHDDGEPVNDFFQAVNQVISGLDPALGHVTPAPAPPLNWGALPPLPAAPPHAAVRSNAVHARAQAAGSLNPTATTPSALSRQRGLAWAHHIRAAAREEFKELRRAELEATGEGDRTRRRKRNDNTMSARDKYRRRLQKNQDSAAAARYAQDAYISNLEAQTERYDQDMTAAERDSLRLEAERDYQLRLRTSLMNTAARLDAEVRQLRRQAGCPSEPSSPGGSSGASPEFAACVGLNVNRVDGVKFPAAF